MYFYRYMNGLMGICRCGFSIRNKHQPVWALPLRRIFPALLSSSFPELLEFTSLKIAVVIRRFGDAS